tara:strand:+ start:1809 stop:1970 length:162 start_codon:yes stop_codon:yes gene_type:complete
MEKKRLYSVPEDQLQVVKEELKSMGLKSDNTQAVRYSVFVMSQMIKKENKNGK